jgi:hypothetical protein
MGIEINKDAAETDLSSDPSAFTAVAPRTPPEDLDADAKYVEYKGQATHRRISEADWQAAGVADQGDVEWSRDTNMRVGVDHFTDEALEVLRRDGGFSVPARNQE